MQLRDLYNICDIISVMKFSRDKTVPELQQTHKPDLQPIYIEHDEKNIRDYNYDPKIIIPFTLFESSNGTDPSPLVKHSEIKAPFVLAQSSPKY